jgi:phosphonate transport system substrate-binding protein
MKKYRLAAIAGVAALGLGLAACSSSSTSSSSASAVATSHVACPNGTITFGVEPYDNASVLIPAYQTLSTDLGQALGCMVMVMVIALDLLSAWLRGRITQ